jgi:hypothetical protein
MGMDAIVLIEILYRGASRSPCLSALDGDGNNRVDLVDPVWTILYLFEGGYSPAPPFPDRGRYGGLRDLPLGCAGSTCEP